MLLSDKTIDLLDGGKIDELIEGTEFTRREVPEGRRRSRRRLQPHRLRARGYREGSDGRRRPAQRGPARLVDRDPRRQHGHDRGRQDRHHGCSDRPAADRGRGARPDDPAGQARALEHRHLARTRASPRARTRSRPAARRYARRPRRHAQCCSASRRSSSASRSRTSRSAAASSPRRPTRRRASRTARFSATSRSRPRTRAARR